MLSLIAYAVGGFAVGKWGIDGVLNGTVNTLTGVLGGVARLGTAATQAVSNTASNAAQSTVQAVRSATSKPNLEQSATKYDFTALIHAESQSRALDIVSALLGSAGIEADIRISNEGIYVSGEEQYGSALHTVEVKTQGPVEMLQALATLKEHTLAMHYKAN